MTLLKRFTDVLGGFEPGKGGGIVGGWGPIAFRGWRVYEVVQSYVDPDGLEFPAIRFRKISGPVTDTISQHISRAASLIVPRTWPYGAGQLTGQFPGLQWHFLDPATLALVAGPLLPIGNTFASALNKEERDKTPITEHVVQWFEHTLPTGPYIGVHTSRQPSETYPLWVSGHPVEIVADRLAAKGEEYETASAAAVIASLGPELQHLRGVTDPNESPQDVINSLSEAYGFTVRRSVVSGKAEFVHWLQKVQDISGLPTITSSHLREEGGPTFDLEESSRISRVRVTGEVITPWTSGLAQRVEKGLSTKRGFGSLPQRKIQRAVAQAAYQDSEKPASGLIITSADITYDYSTDGVTADSETYGESDIEINLNGMPAVADSTVGGAAPLNLEQWAEGRARMIFSPASRGRQMGRFRARRNTVADQALLGAVVVVDVDWSPNAQLGQTPTSQRGGPRPFRVVENTPELSGPDLLLADEGTGVQYGTVPDISVALDTSAPGMWLITVTNAAALTADGAQLELQCKVFGPSDTPDFTDPGFRYTVDDSSTWTASPQEIRVGPFPIGHQVHFRASAWLFDSAASDWSAWDGLGGGGVSGAISSLVQGTTTSSSVAYTWTNTNSTALVRVQLKLSTESVYGLVIDLPPGSTAYTLTGLLANTAYDVRVVLVQGGTEVGTALTDTATTDIVANQETLSTPLDPEVWGGSVRPSGLNSPGTYGLEVDAVFGPPDMSIVFEEAVETAIGSGTPGSYSIVLTTPAVVGGPTRYQASAPNDLKLRWLRAYAIAQSWDDSTATTALAVDPWPDTPETGTSALLTPGTGLLRVFGVAPDVVIASPATGVTDAEFLVGVAHGSLSAERVVTDTATVTWDLSTAGQAKAHASVAPLGGLPYMYPFGDAIDDPVNDNFREGDGAGGMDTGATRSNPATPLAWVADNIGASPVAVVDGRLWLTSPSDTTLQLRGYYQEPTYLDNTNWCIRMHVTAREMITRTTQYFVGMYLRDSSSGKIECWGLGQAAGSANAHLISYKMTNNTTFSATRFSLNLTSSFFPHFLEIERDGTNYYCRAGFADQPLQRFNANHLFAKTNFLTAEADGIGVFSTNNQSATGTLITRGIYRVPVSVALV